ncbi:unnamed protein product [Phyllotreta striolata]|uniref:Uncharacterized protein n=1 Tax=Phyllotreta striolata TaxID=444603 RepID=A0A9N9TF24_PHYSR|nr:unnamed protein product [Phyllotreta striolata]
MRTALCLIPFLLALQTSLSEDVRLLDLEPPDAQQVIEKQDQSLHYAPKVDSNVPAVRYLGSEPHDVQEDIYQARQYHGQDGLGGYLYGYNIPDIAKTEKKIAGGDLRGAYNYIAQDGQEIKVEYWDDGTGFHQVDNVDKILPKQVEDSPDVKAAKEAFFARWHEEAERNKHPVSANQGPQQSGGYQQTGYNQPSGQYSQQGTTYQRQPNQYQQPGQSGYYQQGSQNQFQQQRPNQYQQGQSQQTGQYQPTGQYQQQSGQYHQQQQPGQYQQSSGQYNQQSGQHHQQPSGQYNQQSGQYNQQPSGQYNQQSGQYHQQQQQQPGQYHQQQPSGQNANVGHGQSENQIDFAGQYSENQNVYSKPGFDTSKPDQYGSQTQTSSSGYSQSARQYQQGGQYQQHSNQAQSSGEYDEKQDEENGPPKGFFYSYDYPVGKIVQVGGIARVGDLKSAYDQNKSNYESQLHSGKASYSGSQSSYSYNH